MSGLTTDVKAPNAKAANAKAPSANPAEIPPSEMGHSLLALMNTHAEVPAETIVQQLDQLATGLENTAELRDESRHMAQVHSLRMAEMYQAISQLLELVHDRIVNEAPPPPFDPDNLQPLANSMNQAFEEIQQRIDRSEQRQFQTLESTLRQWETEREASGADHLLQIESLQVQAQIEVNRLLRVMWLGTGLAATGAGLALFLLRN